MASFADIVAYTVSRGRALGYSDEAIAGILGNIAHESSPAAKGGRAQSFNKAGGGWGAYGLTQVRGSRLEALAKFANVQLDASKKGKRDAIPAISHQKQIDFMFKELETTHKAAGKALKAAKTASEASKVMMEKFEKPSAAHQLSSGSRRAQAAESLLAGSFAVTEGGKTSRALAANDDASKIDVRSLMAGVPVNYAHPERGHWAKGLTDDAVRAVAMLSSKFPGQTLTSAYRSPQHSVERSKKSGGGTHTKGLAFDFDLTGLTNEQRSMAVQTARMAGATRIGAYSRMPNMLHVDFEKGFQPHTKGQTVYSMFDKSRHNMDKAPSWFTQGLTQTKGIPVPTARPDDLVPIGPLRDEQDRVNPIDSFIAGIAGPRAPVAELGLQAADMGKAAKESNGLAAIDLGLLGAGLGTGRASQAKGQESKDSNNTAAPRSAMAEADDAAAKAADSIASIATNPAIAVSAKASAANEASAAQAASRSDDLDSIAPSIDLSAPAAPTTFAFDSILSDVMSSRAERAESAGRSSRSVSSVDSNSKSAIAEQASELASVQDEASKPGALEGVLGGLGRDLDKAMGTIGGFLGLGNRDSKADKDKDGVLGGLFSGLDKTIGGLLGGTTSDNSSGGFLGGLFSNTGAWNAPGNWGDLGMTPGGTSQVVNYSMTPGLGNSAVFSDGWASGDATGSGKGNYSGWL